MSILSSYAPAVQSACDPDDVLPFTLADLAWAAAEFNRDAEDYDVEPNSDDLDGWDSEPDLDTLANRYEQQELAEAGISPANRGFFGHDDRGARPSIHDECVATVQAEVFRLTGQRISVEEAEIRMAGAWARTWGG